MVVFGFIAPVFFQSPTNLCLIKTFTGYVYKTILLKTKDGTYRKLMCKRRESILPYYFGLLRTYRKNKGHFTSCQNNMTSLKKGTIYPSHNVSFFKLNS